MNKSIIAHALILTKAHAASARCINRRHSFCQSNHEHIGDEADALEYTAQILDDVVSGKASIVYEN